MFVFVLNDVIRDRVEITVCGAGVPRAKTETHIFSDGTCAMNYEHKVICINNKISFKKEGCQVVVSVLIFCGTFGNLNASHNWYKVSQLPKK